MGSWGNQFAVRTYQNYFNHCDGKSPAQTALEPHIAALGRIYRAQHPFPAFRIIADFVIPDLGLRIECDGKEHRQPARKREDAATDAKLAAKGWRTVRLTNEEILADPAGALEKALKEEA